ncbi:putative ATP-dependent DNA helicase CHR12 [Drosera capensis]
MKLVNESKNERLTTLLGKTNELLESLGAAVQRQKDTEHSDGTEPSKIDMTAKESVKAGNIFEGQRQYNSAVHSIQEKVTEQPAMLQGGELRPYQVEGLQWMVSLFNNNLNGILADEMGLGKTIQTISIHTVLYDGRKEERSALQQKYSGEEKFKCFLTHYDLIIRDKKFLKKIRWHYMIRRRLLLTGTPIQNSLQELWALLNFLLPNIFKSVDNFEEWFNAPFADRGDVSLTEEEEQLIILPLHHVIRPFVLRRKKEEVEKYLLQKKTQVILKCDMSAWQKVYYHQITDIGRVGLATASRKSKSLQNLSMQLRKCCNHPYLFVGDPSLWHIEELNWASGKFELLDRLLPKLHRGEHRVLLFSQMTKLLDVLQFYLRAYEYDYLTLDGSSKTEDRRELLKKFNALNSPYFIFLLSTRAGGLGLNLQTADTVIIFDSDWNPQMDQQAEDRAHRIGQTKEVRVFVLVSVGSIEEVILERAKQKMGIDAKVIQARLFNTTSTAEERRGCWKRSCAKEQARWELMSRAREKSIALAARAEEEYWLFEKMDEERRLRENYRTRLMEEHEVPDWAYTTPDVNDAKGKGFDYESANIAGKRKRKEVGYSDILNDMQSGIKQCKSADGTSNSIGKGEKKKEKEKQTPLLNSHFMDDTNDVSEEEKDDGMISSERSSDETPVPLPKKLKVKKLDSPEYKDSAGSSRNGSILTWKTHKKKRSSFTVLIRKVRALVERASDGADVLEDCHCCLLRHLGTQMHHSNN